jgi:hypothetical protein
MTALTLLPKEEVHMSTYIMWISIFTTTISLGICFCVATIMMERR